MLSFTLGKLTIETQAIAVKSAGKQLSLLLTEDKNHALYKLAETFENQFETILNANERDLTIGSIGITKV